MLDFLLGSDIVQALVGLVVAFVLALGYGQVKKREGAKEQAAKANEEDIENAEDIRRRVARDLDRELREHEGRGYRD